MRNLLKSFTVKVLAVFGTISVLFVSLKAEIITSLGVFGVTGAAAEGYYSLALIVIISLKTLLGIKGRADAETKPRLESR